MSNLSLTKLLVKKEPAVTTCKLHLHLSTANRHNTHYFLALNTLFPDTGSLLVLFLCIAPVALLAV